MPTRPTAALIALSLMTACGNGEPSEMGSQQASGAVAATPTTTVEPSPTQSATPERTPSPTAAAVADVTIVSTSLIVPSDNDFGLLGYQIAAVVENQGDSWAKLVPFESDWTVLSPTGSVTATGQMSAAYPQYVEPGGTAYLLTYDVANDVEPEEFDAVEIDVEFRSVDGPEVIFEIENTQVRADEFYGMTSTGFVTASEDRDFIEVGLVCLDADGKVIGFANAQILEVTAGERETFETTGPPNEVSAEACADTVIYATPHDFDF